LIHSTIISTVSRSAVSLIAMVPERECSTPTLIGAPCAKDGRIAGAASAAAPRPASAARRATPPPATGRVGIGMLLWSPLALRCCPA
jgi:hypothetical protein